MSSAPPITYDAEYFKKKVLCIGPYHPYWITDDTGAKAKNPAFGQHSGRILDLKNEADPKHKDAIGYFAKRLDKVLSKFELSTKGLIATSVPSHSIGKQSAGLLGVLKSSEYKFDIRPNLLRRAKGIIKLAHGGDRSIETHLHSITVDNPTTIKGRTILLLDDVWTTGNSVRACRRLLLDAGAELVVGVTLGKTTHD